MEIIILLLIIIICLQLGVLGWVIAFIATIALLFYISDRVYDLMKWFGYEEDYK